MGRGQRAQKERLAVSSAELVCLLATPLRRWPFPYLLTLTVPAMIPVGVCTANVCQTVYVTPAKPRDRDPAPPPPLSTPIAC